MPHVDSCKGSRTGRDWRARDLPAAMISLGSTLPVRLLRVRPHLDFGGRHAASAGFSRRGLARRPHEGVARRGPSGECGQGAV